MLASLDEDAELGQAWAAETERRISDIKNGAVKLVLIARALAQRRAELHDPAEFYKLMENFELGLAFPAEFERTANRVLANPQHGAIFHGNRRRYLLRRFP